MEYSNNPKANAEALKSHSFKTGWCYVEDIRRQSFLHPQVDRGLPFAISMALPLSRPIIDTLRDLPTLIYQDHYREVNRYLGHEALEITLRIQAAGFKALPAPVTVSVTSTKGHLSHKVAAAICGLGWIGKSSLLITPEHSARVRLVTVFTDLPLPEPGRMIAFQCGDCDKCIKACPAQAISHDPVAFKRQICYHYMMSLVKKGIVGEQICGLCVQACDGNAGN